MFIEIGIGDIHMGRKRGDRDRDNKDTAAKSKASIKGRGGREGRELQKLPAKRHAMPHAKHTRMAYICMS